MPGEIAFALADATTYADPDDVLDMWHMHMRAPSPDVLSSGADHTSDEPVWRIDLPADQMRATQQLSAARAVAMSATARLPRAADTLFEIIANGTRPDLGSTPAELELASWLQKCGYPVPVVTFAPGKRLTAWMSERVRATAELSDRLAWWCAPVAQVDTRLGERLLGRSALTWRGDVSSIVAAERWPEDVQIHVSAVSLVWLSRATVCQALGIAIADSDLVDAVRAVERGEPFLTPEAQRVLIQCTAMRCFTSVSIHSFHGRLHRPLV